HVCAIAQIRNYYREGEAESMNSHRENVLGSVLGSGLDILTIFRRVKKRWVFDNLFLPALKSSHR
ncbi:MAG: hypothetical protein ACE5JU_23640, partial [Candidatus Binatia bacterium]